MTTNQPVWKCIGNLGDSSPWDYGGAFVMVDTTGVYCPELWLFEVPDCEDEPVMEYRLLLEQCTYIGGVLSDNKSHPEYGVWFGTQECLADLAEQAGISVLELLNHFCSDDPLKLAMAYKLVADVHGPHEFDSYPLTFSSRKELADMKKRMKVWLEEAEEE